MPLSNITSINLSLQTQGAAFVAREIANLAQPSRRIYVFGGASDVFPYFSTFSNALTYANSLTPTTANPVSIVLLSNTNGTPVEISGASDWYALCLAGINVSSPYREIFSTTTLPTVLPKGMRVLYVDANGVESLWVGNASGEAWPSVGYKEYVALITQVLTNAPVATVLSDTVGGTPVWTRDNAGQYTLTNVGRFTQNKKSIGAVQRTTFLGDPISEGIQITVSEVSPNANVCQLFVYEDGVATDGLSAYYFSIRIYP